MSEKLSKEQTMFILEMYLKYKNKHKSTTKVVLRKLNNN